MKAVLCSALFWIILAQPVLYAGDAKPSNTTDEETRVLALETAWNQAESHQDFRALSLLLSDSLSYIDDDGTLMNKTQFLQKARGELVRAQIVNESVGAHVYGTFAVVVGVYRETGVNRGKAYHHRGRFTDTWLRVGNTWQCVASQATLMEQ